MGQTASYSPPVTKHFHALREALPSMAGKTVAITGCTSGTGLVLAQTCGGLGARVMMLNRPSDRAQKALQTLLEHNMDATLVPCDLQRFESVRKASEELHKLCADSGIDVLCNNAGVMGLPDEATPDGYDVQMQSNHLSHFLLTSSIWDLLERAAQLRGEARVVNHTSGARKAMYKPISPEFLHQNGGKLGGEGFLGTGKWRRYQQSKLANILFTYALHDRAKERGSKVKSLVAHPGPTDTGLQGKSVQAGATTWMDSYQINKVLANSHSTEDGSMGIVICSCQPGVESASFYGPAGKSMPGPAVLLPEERDPAGEKVLWEESLKATNLATFFPE